MATSMWTSPHVIDRPSYTFREVDSCSFLRRDHPSAGVEVYVREEVREQDLRRIIELNRLRINGKRDVWALSDKKLHQLLDLIRSDGMIVVVILDGKICAGEICSFVEKSYFSHVGAHDP